MTNFKGNNYSKENMLRTYNLQEIGEMTGPESTTSVGFTYLIQSGNDLEEFYSYFKKLEALYDHDFYFMFVEQENKINNRV